MLFRSPVIQEAWRSFADPTENLIATVGRLTMPVLFAWSRSDWIVSYGQSRAAIASTPRGKIRMFDGGHSAFLEDPNAFAAILIDFLKEEGLLK